MEISQAPAQSAIIPNPEPAGALKAILAAAEVIGKDWTMPGDHVGLKSQKGGLRTALFVCHRANDLGIIAS